MTHAPNTSPNVQNGTYLITANDGRAFSLKLYTRQYGDEWRRVVALMAGSVNPADFIGVAFWNDDVRSGFVWRKHRADGSDGVFDGYKWDGNGSPVERKLYVWADLATRAEGGYWAREGYYVEHVPHCVACNHKLTDPDSVLAGIGPNCEAKKYDRAPDRNE